MNEIITIGIINDLHGPFEDPRSVQLVLDIFEDVNIDEIILNGDVLDFYNINSHGAKNPDVQPALENEFYWGQEFFLNLRKRFPKQKIVFNAGNHCWRLDRFVAEKCPAFWNFLKLEKMLNLEQLDIEFNEYNYAYQVYKTNLFIQHSPPSYSKNCAMTSLERKIDASYIYGCTHRRAYACKTGSTGKLYEAYMNGWLGSTTLTKSHRNVFKYAKGHENWQQAFSIVTVVDKKEYIINQHGINDHKSLVNGYLYEG